MNEGQIKDLLIGLNMLVRSCQGIDENLSIISKRLDKMDINQQGSMTKLIDLFKSDKDVPIV
jgi:hypothetical protein